MKDDACNGVLESTETFVLDVHRFEEDGDGVGLRDERTQKREVGANGNASRDKIRQRLTFPLPCTCQSLMQGERVSGSTRKTREGKRAHPTDHSAQRRVRVEVEERTAWFFRVMAGSEKNGFASASSHSPQSATPRSLRLYQSPEQSKLREVPLLRLLVVALERVVREHGCRNGLCRTSRV